MNTVHKNVLPLREALVETRCSRRVRGVLFFLLLGGVSSIYGQLSQPTVVFEMDHPAAVSVQLQQQRIAQLFQERLKDGKPETVERARAEFVEYLRQGSPIAFEQLRKGKMEDDELSSRVDVFLRERPALTGADTASQSNDPRQRVAELLKRDKSIAATEVERQALADRFLERLSERSRTARDNLVKGKMTEEELLSRINVFIADVHAESTAAAVDPKTAAAAAVVESYLKANFGLSTEHANAISYRGEVESNGTRRQFVIFKKRPGKIRMHILQDGIVVGILAFDGTTAWRQEPSRPAVRLNAGEAAALVRSSRFDDPFIGYRERGADIQRDEQPGKDTILLHLREADGSELIAEIAAANFTQVAARSREAGGEWTETRFSDYRKVGTLNMACMQEEFRQGKLKSTTRIENMTLDSGLLDQFFAQPSDLALGYMDFMGGLALLETKQKQRAPFLPKNSKAAP